MKQNTVRVFVGVGLGCFALFSLAGWAIARLTHASLINNTAFDIRNPQSYGNPFSIGATLGLLFAVLFVAVAYINALVRLIQLRQWGWFATLALLAVFAIPFNILVFAAIITFAVYLLIGPDSPAVDSSSSTSATS